MQKLRAKYIKDAEDKRDKDRKDDNEIYRDSTIQGLCPLFQYQPNKAIHYSKE